MELAKAAELVWAALVAAANAIEADPLAEV